MQQQEKTPKNNAFNSLVAIGERYHSVPEQLYTDDRLTNRAKILWQMLKVDSSPYKSQFFPSYEQMQLWLSEQAFLGKKVSRKVVTQTLQILRLTRWITLCETERDTLGRIVGNVYIIHNTSLSVMDTIQITDNYFTFVDKMSKSKDNFVRAVAESVIDELISEKTYHAVSHLEAYREAFERKNTSKIQLTPPQDPLPKDLSMVTDNVKHRILQDEHIEKTHPISQDLMELGEKQLNSIKELSNDEQNLLSSIMELSKKEGELNGTKQNENAKSLKSHLVPSGNLYSTSTNNINNTNTNTKNNIYTVFDEIELTENEKGNIIELLNKLDKNLRLQVVEEARLSLKARQIQRPAGYLFAMVNRALQGQFNPYYILQQKNHTEIAPNMVTSEPIKPQKTLTEEEIKKAEEVRRKGIESLRVALGQSRRAKK
ncbi:STY4528 family pathogenicity island replication protein [Actinobacillus delphinicola]|uniref:Uncharacterized protein n=1 Tax=Actinobacillus delphinicola TaxID=51161 RepID=A0A448TTV1_9PAST|nr:STY4528 family pathogenicity island replication protein [Actinobacillus delphinicola]VEJ09366.1 Uncharacterised protein [Actinobacillus delphinicola]